MIIKRFKMCLFYLKSIYIKGNIMAKPLNQSNQPITILKSHTGNPPSLLQRSSSNTPSNAQQYFGTSSTPPQHFLSEISMSTSSQ